MAYTINGITYLEGDGTWPFAPSIDGNDLVCRNCVATYFDDQETASGVSAATDGVLGCALPLSKGVCEGSPLPAMIPFRSQVVVYSEYTRRQVDVELIDIGPAKSTRHDIDLTPAAVAALGLTLAAGVYHLIDYRILGAAQYTEDE